MSCFQKISQEAKWRELLSKTLFRTFFHEPEWETFLEKQFSWLRFERYLYKDQALLSLACFKVGAQKKLVSHPFCEYGGPLPLIKGVGFQQFKRDVLAEFKQPLKVSFHPYLLNYFSDPPQLRAEGLEERETFLLENLAAQDLDQIWQSALDRNRRRSIKKAQNEGIEVRECQTEKELKKLYQLYVQNLKKHQTVVYPFSFFKFFFQTATCSEAQAQQGRQGYGAKILLAKLKDRNLGGNIFLTYNGIVHSFLCGFDERYKNLGVHSLVLWKMIARTKAEGFSTFDLGATKKDSPLRSFKQRWGAREVPILEIKNYSQSKKLKGSPLRKVWGLLPTCLIKVLSPYFIKHRF